MILFYSWAAELTMRGKDEVGRSLFSYVDLERRDRVDHPRQVIRALLLQAFYSTRWERQLVERSEFDPLFLWLLALGMDDPAWDATIFTKNRDRLLAGGIGPQFLLTLPGQEKVRALLSTERFSVDCVPLEDWAKRVAGLCKSRHRRPVKTDWQFAFVTAADNLVRLPKLLMAAPL